MYEMIGKTNVKMKKNVKGITMISLVITIAVLLIIAGVTVNIGLESIQRVEFDELKTNMLLLEAKATGIVEDLNFKIGLISDPITEEQTQKIVAVKLEVLETENKLKLNTSDGIAPEIEIPGVDSTTAKNLYVITEEAITMWELSEIKLSNQDQYLIGFDEKNATVEIYTTRGYEGKYILSEIKNIEI